MGGFVIIYGLFWIALAALLAYAVFVAVNYFRSRRKD